MNLLLVDDDVIDRMRTRTALEQSGFDLEIEEATTAEECLSKATSSSFDIVLLDYHLPAMNGLEVLKRLRESGEQCAAVAMLSHCEDEALAIQCIEAGAQDFLMKGDVTASRLMRAIRQAKERYRFEKQLIESHEKLRQLAELDTVTGLANRYKFEEELRKTIENSERTGEKFALLILDLDKFKQVNDNFGHDAGDRLLKRIGDRLAFPIREGDVLSRLGGDEFAILLKNVEFFSTIHQIADRILQILRKPIQIEGTRLIITASIGIATYPACGRDAINLMKCADIAMYRSKEAGRSKSNFYSRDLHEKVAKRSVMEQSLYRALGNQEFVLFYQPQISAIDGSLLGIESLIRWDSPTRGLLAPHEFIPIAEEIGIIDQIGFWVLETAFFQFHYWREFFNADELGLSIAINISAVQLSNSQLFNKVVSAMAKYRIPPKSIELELTEGAMNDSRDAANLLERFAAMGIKLVLDDFGTGYSSLFRLQKNPFRVLKIDKSFIHAAGEDNDKPKFLRAISAFARTLGVEVVAEGVETELQKQMCEELMFDRMQGFYFAKPMRAQDFAKTWLTKRQTYSVAG